MPWFPEKSGSRQGCRAPGGEVGKAERPPERIRRAFLIQIGPEPEQVCGSQSNA